MPKSTPASSPPSNKSARSLHDPADSNSLRKKKNADAQAAFRARRQNYISTLEETVTSLESVVLQLQESCREARNEAMEVRNEILEARNENMILRREISRLCYQDREREKYWKNYIQPRKPAPPPDDLPPPPPPPPLSSSPFPGHSVHPPTLLPLTQEPFGNDPAACQLYDHNFSDQQQHVPVAFTGQEETVVGLSRSLLDRGEKFPAYPYAIQGSPRSARWQVPPNSNIPDSVASQRQSPSYMNSPLTTSADVAYTGRFIADERKVALLSSSSYVFPEGNRYHNAADSSVPNSRSMSPSTSTASSATSLPLTSSYQLGYQDASTGHDATEFDYQPQPPLRAEVTLHGGVADVTVAGQHPDAPRYRLGGGGGGGRSESGDKYLNTDQIIFSNEGGSQHDDSRATRLRVCRNVSHPYHHRSPSPGPTPVSCTVAVIKAQAFGALRRTRTKTKRTTDGAAKVALDVLEARGINIGPTSDTRHSQLDDGELDMEDP